MNKKLRSLFEFLDSDQDGRITSECLQSGMNRLLSDMNMYGDSTTICEYEVEELLRCIPR